MTAIPSSSIATLPPLLAYPERRFHPPGPLERAGVAVSAALLASRSRARAAKLLPVLEASARFSEGLRALSDAALRATGREAGAALRADPNESLESIARVLAAMSEASARVLGQRPYPPQVCAALACVQGRMVEMATGEGKTLAASLAAATVALSGTPVHILTVNRYLAERDAAFAQPLYGFFGLGCGLVTEAVAPQDRRAAYRCPITVAVNKDIAFDYMRDRLALGRSPGNARRKVAGLRGDPGSAPLLRGLYHAIIDEADSVLIDEARTPLILATGSDDAARSAEVFDRALDICDRLRPGIDYALIEGERRTVLLPAGKLAVAAQQRQRGHGPARPGHLSRHRAGTGGPDEPGHDVGEGGHDVGEGDHDLGGGGHGAGEQGRGDEAPWDVAAEREHLIEQALTARLMLIRDEHYLVRDGKAQIIDEFTGRVLPDRTWNDGLQELVERKEGLDLSPRHETEARMTYQRFARRYRRLSGLSGTLHEVAGELWRVYGVPVVRVPANRPDRKTNHPPVGHADDAAKWHAITARAEALHAAGMPVLIGTRTLAASERAAAALAEAGLPHVVLNAAQDAAEAEIIAAAGQPGAITVATNMAGRGTDIRIGDTVVAGGGLRVIVCEPHEARRIDRQLIGRCGRQGQPGETEVHVSLDDALLVRHCTAAERAAARALLGPTGGRSVVLAARRAQWRSERLHAGMRRDLLRSDEWLEDAIAFAGDPE